MAHALLLEHSSCTYMSFYKPTKRVTKQYHILVLSKPISVRLCIVIETDDKAHR